MKKSKLLILFLLSTIVVFGQYKRKPKDPFPKAPQFEQSGWILSPGVIYSIGNPLISDVFDVAKNITSSLTQKLKTGLYLEGGRYNILNKLYFFRYLDYGLAYKMTRGIENFTNTQDTGLGPFGIGSGENRFTDHSVNLFFNMSNIITLSDKLFLQNSIGLLGEFFAVSKRIDTNPYTRGWVPNSIRSEVTYKFGVGFKLNPRMLIIPSIQASILNLTPWQGLSFMLPYFSSEFKPIVLSVRVLFLSKTKSKYCPPVDAIGIPEAIEKQQR